jgi:hypothetical protein
LNLSLETLSGIAYQAYAAENHLFLDVSLWKEVGPADFKRKLEQAGALLAVKQPNRKDEVSFRHQLLHDYLVGYYLAQHTPLGYGILHGATWRGENPEPVNFALEIIGNAGANQFLHADNFLNHVYDWNYSVTIGSLRDMEESRRSIVSDFFKGAVAALIALKTADYFVETRLAGANDLRIFNQGLAQLWRDAVISPELNDEDKVQNLLQAVQKNFDPSGIQDTHIVDYALWKTLFCSKTGPISGQERFLFADSPLIGWTAANSFRRTGFETWFLDRLKGAFRALRETGVSDLNGRPDHGPAARVVRRRIVHILGIAQDADTVELLEQAVFDDQKEDEDVKNDGLRSLLEIASKQQAHREWIVGQIASRMENLTPYVRRRILRSHRVIQEDSDWRSRMLGLIERGKMQEPEERYKSIWESAKEKLSGV